MNAKFAIFIISCDKNAPIVRLLVDSIRQQFPSPVEIYVSTDGVMPELTESDVTVFVSKGRSFGARLQEALAQVPYEQVIVMCDDFIVEAPVKMEELRALSSYMQEHPTVASIALAQVSGANTSEYLFGQYVKRAEFGKYKTTLQCALWQKDVFQSLMDGIQSPWEFELFATHHTYHSGMDYYALIDDSKMPIVYNRGKFVIRGHVVLPEKERLEQVFGRVMDVSGFPVTESFEQGRGMSLMSRIKRKARVLSSHTYYRYWKGR